MGTTACIIQARLGSTRLPAKVLLPLPTGRTVLEEVLWRCAHIPGVDVVVLAMPDTAENDILVANGVKKQTSKDIPIVRGPEHDVLARYAKATKEVGATSIMRITADCPLIDPQVCGEVLRQYQEQSADYASNTIRRSWPEGYECQIVSRRLLLWAHANASEPYDREHVLTFVERKAAPGFHQINVSTSPDRSHERYTLDTVADYVKIWNAMQEQMREAA